jgi:flagellar motor switch protein FliN/FliY
MAEIVQQAGLEGPGAETGAPAVLDPVAGAGAPEAAGVASPGPAPKRPTGSASAPAAPGTGSRHALRVLQNVEMAVTVELGRARLAVRELLDLRAGSIVELDRAAGSLVDVMVNGTLLARGEVVVVDDELGVRITEVVGGESA